MSEIKTNWARMKGWRGGSGLPVLPPVGALVELLVLVALILVVDWALPSVDLSNLEPSPYWLPVLLLSLQYGTVAGLMAAAVATAAYVFNGVAEQAVGENFFTFLLRIWALPILWIGVALVLGQFRLRQIAEKQDLRQNLAKRTVEAQSLSIYSKDLAARCSRLERQLTTRSKSSVTPVMTVLARFGRTTASVDEALSLLTEVLWPGAKISLFVITPAGSEAVAISGWSDSGAWPTEIPSTHSLYRAVVSERRVVSILYTGDELVLGGHGVLACPIFAPETSRVTGMLKVEAIDPALLTAEMHEHLELIARLAAPMFSEPRIVVDNTERTSANDHHGSGERLTRGWNFQPWRGSSQPGDGSAKTSVQTSAPALVETGNAGDATDRSARPRRLS